ncbi:hypothetical protein GGH94_001447 [Coemansia aciculifera]|uniref:valine--tRNA ligase n=1 Tax=Coemansia aciculifera TaxID=417176 RepID=A0A9W8IQT1_9FUNG|nr:hypothetical protein GGH94_001447 [Coemansia aciculifera]
MASQTLLRYVASSAAKTGRLCLAGRTSTLRQWYTAPVHKLDKYSPEIVESDWYSWWQQRGLFDPKKVDNASNADEFSMLLPPPNVTGVLHIGHALTLSIQDAIARWNRMHGRSVNWVPGTDHAGISMQTVVEKKLERETGKTRHDLGRQAFIDKVWEWKHEHGDRIKQQTKSLGASLNWNEEYFTMDPRHSQLVRDAFIRLYDDGLIYRSTKMVSWSCALQSVISDIEVDKIPTEGRTLIEVPGTKAKVEFGVLHMVEFPIVDPAPHGPLSVRVETTRPETMLGDVALAICSRDDRYKGLEGKYVVHPLLAREIPIIHDDDLVNPEFGTGVITPAHDENDYACAQRHGLLVVPVFGPAGTVVDNPHFSDYIGKSRWETRRKVISDLKDTSAYLGSRDAETSVVSKCSRSGDIIEPMLMPQWYLRCSEMAKTADDLVQRGNVSLIPKRQQATWHSWLTETEDWCVSRQLWWGHRIPVYHVRWEGSIAVDLWVAATSEEQARAKALNKLSAGEKDLLASTTEGGAVCTVTQDEDVLDTWFSSGLLPLLAFNHASNSKMSSLDPDTCAQGPSKASLSTVLETGQDIIFFWVARMTMLCTYFAQIPPFSTVLLHPMVRDAQGRKMSKSLGNVIDPMDVINGAELSKLQDTLRRGYLSGQELKRGTKELAKMYPNGFQQFGADALRFTLLLYTQQTQQINMSLDGVRASYHFCNKLWNTFRFIHMHADKLEIHTDHVDQNSNKQWFADINDRELTVFDRALLSRLHGMLHTYHSAMEAYRLAAAAEAVRVFVQRDLCDRYIEICKLSLFGNQNATNQAISGSNDSSDNVITMVVSPHVRVVARLTGKVAAQPAQTTSTRKATSAATMAKLESELEKVRSVVGSAGYQRSAPDIVKEADTKRLEMLEAKIAAGRK